MTGLILLAVIVDRRGISMRLVAWAATVILLIRPEAILSVSFQMSFAAVVALVAVYEVVGDKFRRSLGARSLRNRLAVYLASILLTTLVASLATAMTLTGNVLFYAGEDWSGSTENARSL